MKRIQTRIVFIIFCVIVVLSVVFGVISSLLNSMTANDVLEQSLRQSAEVAADLAASELESVKQVALETGCTARLANPDVELSVKKSIIDQKVSTYGFVGGNLLDTKGISQFDGKDFSDRDYFQAAIKGESFISGPLVSKLTGEYSIMIAAPVWKDGVPDSTIVGVVYFKPDLYMLSEITDQIAIGKTGGAYIVNGDGLNIAHKTRELVCANNSIESAKTDSSLQKIAAIESDMIKGNTGYGSYDSGGQRWLQGYAPIEGTKWSLGVYALENDFTGNVKTSILITVVMAVLAILIGTVVAGRCGSGIAKPINQCVERIAALAKGDLKSPVPTIHTKDETMLLAQSTQSLLTDLSGVVDDISHVLGEMASGNLNVQSTRTYTGDFVPIQTATQQIISSLNGTLLQINQTAEQVSEGSSQVSAGAQSLSQGATEQAAAVEELAASIAEISDQIKQNANSAQQAKDKANQTGQEIMNSNHKMSELNQAMQDISHSSSEIGKIIKTIEDIAFQTNILALNAAVEAARAGEAGKGFAVVANEVRSLAIKSQDASKNTTALIGGSLEAVKKGMKIAEDTAQSMVITVEGAKDVTATVNQISEASAEQAILITQLAQGVDQISDVVQTTSATAEESAAASVELSQQAQEMRTMVSHFRLQ